MFRRSNALGNPSLFWCANTPCVPEVKVLPFFSIYQKFAGVLFKEVIPHSARMTCGKAMFYQRSQREMLLAAVHCRVLLPTAPWDAFSSRALSCLTAYCTVRCFQQPCTVVSYCLLHREMLLAAVHCRVLLPTALAIDDVLLDRTRSFGRTVILIISWCLQKLGRDCQ